MNSVELINRLRRQAPRWSRASLLKLIDAEQRYALSTPVSVLRLFDGTTGKDPILTTVSGQSVYEISSAEGFDSDVWKVTRVRTTDGTEIAITDEYGESNSVRSIPAKGSDSAKIIFNFDPGDSKTYYLECYTYPQELSSENVELTIPDEFVDSYLYEAVIGQIEKSEHGVSNTYNTYLETLLPSLRNELNKEAVDGAVGTAVPIVTSIIDSIKALAPEWERERFIIEINSIQTVIFDYYPELLRIMHNGGDPILTTAQGVYSYDLVSAVPATFGYDVGAISEIYTASGTVSSVSDLYSDRKTVRLVDKLGDEPAKVHFNFDPDVDTYFVKCYRTVTPVTSENDDLSLPTEYVWTTLIEGLIGKLKLIASGDATQYLTFINETLPRLANHLGNKDKEHHVHGATEVTKFIDSVMKEIRGFSRTDIIDEMNIIQKQILNVTGRSFNRVYDSEGKDPELTVVEGQFIYELNVANFGYDISSVSAVYDAAGDMVPEVSTRKALGSRMAQVIFGETLLDGATYRIECYTPVQDIVNENSSISIPSEYIYDYLYEGVVGRLTQYQKKGSQRLRDFNHRLKATLAWELDKEVNSNIIHIEQRGY